MHGCSIAHLLFHQQSFGQLSPVPANVQKQAYTKRPSTPCVSTSVPYLLRDNARLEPQSPGNLARNCFVLAAKVAGGGTTAVGGGTAAGGGTASGGETTAAGGDSIKTCVSTPRTQHHAGSMSFNFLTYCWRKLNAGGAQIIPSTVHLAWLTTAWLHAGPNAATAVRMSAS